MTMFNVLLFEPEIPGNTGNVIRLCANTGARLHLIGGLDYHDLALLERHADLAACVAKLAPSRLVIVETGATRRVSDVALARGECLLFGPESRGLPADVGADLGIPLVRASLPMRPSNRSLNLANAVAVTVYEAWRQNGFDGAGDAAHLIRTPP
jgi:tRNA (cytidine/uridine-2'-O-)-methyltransferase